MYLCKELADELKVIYCKIKCQMGKSETLSCGNYFLSEVKDLDKLLSFFFHHLSRMRNLGGAWICNQHDTSMDCWPQLSAALVVQLACCAG